MLIACNQNPERPDPAIQKDPNAIELKLEEISVFKAKKDGKEATKGELTYKEAKLYTGKDQLKEQWYYNKQGQITTKEKFSLDGNPSQPDSSFFYTLSDSLLSYYTFRYDKKGNQIARFSFDGYTDELLRQETFQYDDNGNRIGRNIISADDVVVRSYKFKFDDEGNESSYQVFNNKGIEISGEEYKITERDDDGQWTEMWGFKDDEPVTIKTRNIKKYVQTLKEIKQ